MYIEFVVGHGQWAFADDDRQKDKRREDGETGVVIRIGNGKQMEESGRNNESRTGFGLCLSVCLCKNNEAGLQKSTIGY
jgi:hypothetical protein